MIARKSTETDEMGRIHYMVVAAKIISVFLISFFLWNCAGNCRGTEKICTQIGCGDAGVSITLPDLKPGQYRLTITADNQRFQRYWEDFLIIFYLVLHDAPEIAPKTPLYFLLQ